MKDCKAVRQSHEYVQHNQAPPERVFPLLCPAREAEWVDGWKHRMVYSASGIAEPGAVFVTPAESGDGELTWMCTEYDPQQFRVSYAWVWPGMIATYLRIALAPSPDGTTVATVGYTYTGLSAEGNRRVEGFDRAWYESRMRGWEAAINHYLRTGQCLRPSGRHPADG